MHPIGLRRPPEPQGLPSLGLCLFFLPHLSALLGDPDIPHAQALGLPGPWYHFTVPHRPQSGLLWLPTPDLQLSLLLFLLYTNTRIILEDTGALENLSFKAALFKGA